MIKLLKKLKNVRSAGVVLKPNSLEIIEIFEDIKEIFKNSNIDIFLDKDSATMIGKDDGVTFDTLCKRVDFLVSLGGDGTLISVARRGFKYNLPVLGVHLGTLGFLTDIELDNLPKFLEQLKRGDYKIAKRAIIEGCVNDKKFFAFNDIVISRKSVTNMLKVDAINDKKLFNSYYCDALIVSTPTGSTAYNLSSGGPLLHPQTDAFLITPVAPHSLTQRPLVLPKDFDIEFFVPDALGATLIVDGQDTYDLKQNDTIKIRFAKRKAKLINRAERDYFEVLNKKLHWGN